MFEDKLMTKMLCQGKTNYTIVKLIYYISKMMAPNNIRCLSVHERMNFEEEGTNFLCFLGDLTN